MPSAADFVICTDVIEHIGPALLFNVLDHLRLLTNKYFFAVIATEPAKKILSYGRNAHLIVEKEEWWKPHIQQRFNILEWDFIDNKIRILATPKINYI